MGTVQFSRPPRAALLTKGDHMADTRQWRFTVTDFHPETWPHKGTKVGLQITDGDKIFYRSAVIAEERTRGLSHDDVVRLAWNDLKGAVGIADVEGRTFVIGESGTPQPVAPAPSRIFELTPFES